ncbi:MAG: GNAT family N-acetyltransferase [Candidatus Acidiferrales bacterium]
MAERQNQPNFVFEPLGPNHDRAAFSCGVPQLDIYLKTQAGQSVRKNLAAVFVMTPDGKTIAGYYTLSQYSIFLDSVPEALAQKLSRHNEVPATLIGRLARSTAIDYGIRLGPMLLMDALHRCLILSREIASWTVVVDAKDEKAEAFYKEFGFIDLKVPRRLFLPMQTIAKMFQ